MTKGEKTHLLGLLGERIVTKIVLEAGATIDFDESVFDSEKDLTVNGKLAEVKTQVPFYMMQAFTIAPNQKRKCQNVDYLFFVSIPKNDEGVIEVYCCKNKQRNLERITSTAHGTMIYIPINECEHVRTIDRHALVNEAIKLSTSGWRGY